MNRVVILGLVVALPIVLVATPTPAGHGFEGCVRIPDVSISTGIPDSIGTILEGGDRVVGPTSSIGIPLGTGNVFEGCDRLAGPTSSTGIPILTTLSGLPTYVL